MRNPGFDLGCASFLHKPYKPRMEGLEKTVAQHTAFKLASPLCSTAYHYYSLTVSTAQRVSKNVTSRNKNEDASHKTNIELKRKI